MSLGLLLTGTWLGIVWFNAKYPPPEKIWQQTAIMAERRPAVAANMNGHDTELTYVLINKTNEDYRIEYDASFPVVLRDKQGKLSRLGNEAYVVMSKPVSIPAGQKAFMKIRLQLRRFAESRIAETRAQDALASFRVAYPNAEYFEVFDSGNQCRIELPIPGSVE